MNAKEIAAKQAEEAAKKAAEEARKAAEEAENGDSNTTGAKTREQIIAEMKANDANFVVRVTINGINAAERVAENGHEYNN